MEDDYFVAKDGTFAAVYDGHGGAAISKYLKQNLYAQVRTLYVSSYCYSIKNFLLLLIGVCDPDGFYALDYSGCDLIDCNVHGYLEVSQFKYITLHFLNLRVRILDSVSSSCCYAMSDIKFPFPFATAVHGFPA